MGIYQQRVSQLDWSQKTWHSRDAARRNNNYRSGSKDPEFSANTRGFGGHRRASLIFAPQAPNEGTKLYRFLRAGDCAEARALWAFDFEHISVEWAGPEIVVAVDWPERLRPPQPERNGIRPEEVGASWLLGLEEWGEPISLTLDDLCPHMLIAGQTRTGKSWAMRSAAIQLSEAGQTRLIFMDLKNGKTTRTLQGLRGLVGPVITELNEAESALRWLRAEMERRYDEETFDTEKPVVAFVDEFPLLTMKRPAAAEDFQRLASLGGEAGVHLVCATQKVLEKTFGSNMVKENFTGRLVFRTSNDVASRLALGTDKARADHLTLYEALLAAPDRKPVRVILFRMTEAEIVAIPKGKPEMEKWPSLGGSDCRDDLVYVYVNDQRQKVNGRVDWVAHIGHSIDPQSRSGAQWLEKKWTLVATLPGGKPVEKDLHRRFSPQRIWPKKEAFWIDDELGAWLVEVRRGKPLEIRGKPLKRTKPKSNGRLLAYARANPDAGPRKLEKIFGVTYYKARKIWKEALT